MSRRKTAAHLDHLRSRSAQEWDFQVLLARLLMNSLNLAGRSSALWESPRHVKIGC